MAEVLSFSEYPEAYGLPPLKPDHRRSRGKRPAIAPSGKLVLPSFYDSTLIKPLEAIPGLKLEPASLEGQIKPRYAEIEFSQCRIDHNYQRELLQSNLNIIQHGVNFFDWTLYKVPNGIQAPSGLVYITDGQSSALICLHHPDIHKLPIMVTRVKDAQFIQRSARAFIGLNECRIEVGTADRFTALQTMGDPVAIKMAEVFRRYGIRPIRQNKHEGKFGAGETKLVSTFQGLHARHGDEFLERLCKILGNAKYGPIRRMHVHAIRSILLPDMGKNKIDDERLVNAIRSMVDRHAINEAELTAKRRMWPSPKALAELYMSLYKAEAKALS